jgi:flagellar basal-body rod modification protein FlgD
VSGATNVPASSATSAVDRPDQVDKDTFLKLLVAQMKYQDPSNPASSSDLMAQTATFSQVEQLENIAKQNTSLLALQRSLSAGALVGQTVSYTDTTGAPQVGVVSSVTIATDNDPSMATVNGVSVDVGRITKVSAPVAATSATPQS